MTSEYLFPHRLTRPEFIAPHAITVDSKGNFYVVEWVPYGRVRKLAHTPA